MSLQLLAMLEAFEADGEANGGNIANLNSSVMIIAAWKRHIDMIRSQAPIGGESVSRHQWVGGVSKFSASASGGISLTGAFGESALGRTHRSINVDQHDSIENNQQQ